MEGVTDGNVFTQPLLKSNMHSREEELQQKRMTAIKYLGYAVSLPLKMKFHLYFFHAHTKLSIAETGHENSAGFSLKASCVLSAKSLSWPYRSLRLSFPWLCNKSSGVVLQRSLLCVKGCTPGQLVLVFPDRAAGPNKEEASVRGPSPPGIHPILRERYLCQTGVGRF